MRKLILALAAVAALAVAGPAGAATIKTVNIYGSTFSPKTVTITEGDTVTWVNKDNSNHQILADKGQFVSPILKPNQKYPFTFNAAGTYTYKDELYPKLKGTVTVKGLPPTLTLAASSQYVVYGDKVTLSGVVSNHKGGEQVSIYYQPYPQPNLIQKATVLTAADGTFSFIVSPTIATSYQATWKGAYAAPTSVQVQPKLTLGRNNGWIIHAAAGVSFAGKAVQLQRLNRITGQWVTLRKVILNSKSSARVLLNRRLPKGLNQLRVTMSVNQAGAGFLGAISPTVKYRQLI
jgi:plastocyanin